MYVCMCIYIYIYISFKNLHMFLSAFWTLKRSFSARLPSKMKLRNSKTKLFCETSFKNDTSGTNRVTSDHKGDTPILCDRRGTPSTLSHLWPYLSWFKTYKQWIGSQATNVPCMFYMFLLFRRHWIIFDSVHTKHLICTFVFETPGNQSDNSTPAVLWFRIIGIHGDVCATWQLKISTAMSN